eukprot:TRINITY_DN26458_c0_g1_i3.p1 TRINITY_DN26458_c0_g1~~TRINITY_DN26458_c0_g1_i3.p1  ORF type:complete len:140 (+),score=17.09 TRINITY_DN26458_c0_g1_i3:266-685(+)
MCKQFLPLLRPSSSIVNVGSISAQHADGKLAMYNASKGFVHSLTRSIALDHGPDIRCNAVCPGWIMTSMADTAFDLASDPAAAKADAMSRHPMRRLGSPDDVARVLLFLASDQASWITGQTVVVDGGLTAGSPLQPGLF